jgi:hypothetical protein
VSSLASSQSMKPNAESQAGAPANAKFLAIADQFVKESLALSPVNASQAGYHKHLDTKSGKTTGKTIMLDAELDDLGTAGIAAQLSFYREWRQKFQSETPVASLNAQDAADYRLIDDQISANLLELEHIQNYKHNPTVYVELLGSGLFLPMTQDYAPKAVRVEHVISRIEQIPRFLEQARSQLLDADPVFISTAVDENAGNVDMVDGLASDIPADAALKARYDKAAPPAKKALNDFSNWMKNDLAKRPVNGRTWRLGSEWYALKFRYVMETSIDPAKLLAEAESEINRVRGEMLQLALPLYKEMYPGQDDFSNLPAQERENKIIVAVLDKIGEEHPQRDQLMAAIQGDLAVPPRQEDCYAQQPNQSEGDTDAGVPARYLLCGGLSFRATAGADRGGAILGDAHRSENARRQGRKQASRIQQLHLAMAQHARGAAGSLYSGGTCQ